MDFKNYLREQGELHPAMKAQDAVKMIYQAAFGAEHLLEDEEAAEKYFMKEYSQVPACPEMPLFEDISEDMCRVNLGAWKGRGLPEEWLFRMFAASAKEKTGSREDFDRYLEEADREIARGGLDFSYEEWRDFREEYLKGGIRAIHHSAAYRAAERPAYRLVRRSFTRIMPVLEKAAALSRENEGGSRTFVIAIDGRAASGKTTMAGQLKEILGGQVVRMDDFFLPAGMRTRQRFQVPGSNVHYERFAEEVLPHIRESRAFSYRRFDCSVMDFDAEPVIVPAARWRIAEGSYSHHPELGEYADIKVFSAVDPGLQMERIISRNGYRMAEIFAERWIPMEEEYFENYRICQKAHIII